MQQPTKNRRRHIITIKSVSLLVAALFTAGAVLSEAGNKSLGDTGRDMAANTTATAVNKDSIESVKAFMEVYKVLMSPRCMNCHPSGDIPLQGDDSHPHIMSPQRGSDGSGVYAMKCSNCHQAENTAGLHSPPGNPAWHLPPANMRMVFQGKTAHELAKQLIDPSKNGHKNRKQLEEHARDTLVKWGWNPGDGRTLPPLSYEAFTKVWLQWIRKGAYAPAP